MTVHEREMGMGVNFSELLDAFEFVSSVGSGENTAYSPAEFRRSRRPLKPQSVLTDEDAAEIQKILAVHTTGVGKAQLVLSAPHNASLS